MDQMADAYEAGARIDRLGPLGTVLDTPCLVVDLNVLERNIVRMADVCRAHNVSLRPHIKTHKTPWVARQQINAGAVGITVAKLGEAEVFVDAGFTDVLVAYQVVGEDKTRRLIDLSRRATISTCVDDLAVAEMLSAAGVSAGVRLRVLLDVDTGLERTGAPPESAVDLGRKIAALPGLELVGVFSYAGYRPGDPDERNRRAWARQEAETAVAVAQALRDAGVDARTVSVSGTVCAPYAVEVPGVTEVRPGTYVFGDANYTRLAAQTLEDCALRIRTTVVGRPAPARAVLDAGTKVLSSDRAVAAPQHWFGVLPGHPRSLITRGWEEHAVVELATEDRSLRIGDVIDVIPNHACVVSNLADRWYAIRDGVVQDVHAVAARGRVS